MTSKTVAIIDLGSNTFHLLICKIEKKHFHEIYRKRLFVGLAEGGIQSINQSALDRAEEGFKTFQGILSKYDIDEVSIIGTAAIRSAENAHKVDELSSSILGQPITIIEGKREAELIYKGVSLVADIEARCHLIMDIGGGSTEFILVENGSAIWSQSFNIGVAVLHDMFHKTEPIAATEIATLEKFLGQELLSLTAQLQERAIVNLIGASGSFEVIVTMNGGELSEDKILQYQKSDFTKLEDDIILSNYEKRAQLEGMPESRVKLFVVAFILMRYVIKVSNPESILVSPYALKEGIISEMMS